MTVFYDELRGGTIEKTPRKTDFGNTDKFSARKKFRGVLRKVGNPRGVYCNCIKRLVIKIC